MLEQILSRGMFRAEPLGERAFPGEIQRVLLVICLEFPGFELGSPGLGSPGSFAWSSFDPVSRVVPGEAAWRAGFPGRDFGMRGRYSVGGN